MKHTTPIPSRACWNACIARMDQIDAMLADLQAERERLGRIVTSGRIYYGVADAAAAMRRRIERGEPM